MAAVRPNPNSTLQAIRHAAPAVAVGAGIAFMYYIGTCTTPTSLSPREIISLSANCVRNIPLSLFVNGIGGGFVVKRALEAWDLLSSS